MKAYLFQKTFSIVTAWNLVAFGASFGKGQYLSAGIFVIIGLVVHIYSGYFDAKRV